MLQEDRIQFLTTINTEAKVRRANQSLVLGKAKVMSYKELEEARAKRAERDAAQEAKGKGKRGRKSKSSPPEPEEDAAETARRGFCSDRKASADTGVIGVCSSTSCRQDPTLTSSALGMAGSAGGAGILLSTLSGQHTCNTQVLSR
jgi:hypothetical protein